MQYILDLKNVEAHQVHPDPLVPETDFVIKEGHVNVPTGHGLGITVDEAALKKHTLLHEIVT